LQPYLLLDAGGTLVFPDCPLLRQVMLQHGCGISEERLRRMMAEGIRQYDEVLKSDKDGSNVPGFLQWIVEQVGIEQQHKGVVLKQLRLIDAERGIWAYTRPWVREALARLSAQGYRMSVISNADGRVREQLEYLRLADHFEEIFDSHAVGYAKPDSRLFEHALTKLELPPAECLYVGDVYFIDVLGANRVGIAAVHLDPYGLYGGWEGCHIPTIAELPDFLASGDLNLQSEVFFPLRPDGIART